MKKTFYSIFAIFILCFMIFSNHEQIEAEKLDIYDFDSISNIMKKNKTKMSGLSFNKNVKKEKTFEYDKYIDDYAGSFVKDGQLIVLTTKGNNQTVSSRLNKSNQTHTVKFSMNQLNDAMNDINLYKKYHGETFIAKQFNLYWLDVENNQIVVEFDNLNEENIKLFKNEVLDEEFIVFKQIEAKPQKEASIYPGSKIKVKSSYSSVAYRATRNNVSITLDGVTHFNLVGANYKSDHGDSGGLVFFKVPGENLINTVGVHMAGVGSTKYYCRASEVNKALYLKRY
ncbi:hypothetical protein [Helcococcus kunzii]|uniref:hypothetical protein n=1 Tax=Helcococcus kunzii TaxID=40091 RepID=UPI0021A922BF|nr:hypothetical protein [Helcococcus kunzii]MCT1797034.1 hypothetical protein [Helcococcus kunzii]